jgi:hypothetical protein
MSTIRIPPEKIRAFVEKHFDSKPRKQGEELVICNPLNGDTGYHFNISLNKGVCHDWRGDEWSGSINPKTGKRSCSFVRFVSLYLKCSTGDAIKAILDGSAIEFNKAEKIDLREYDIELPTGCLKLSDHKGDRFDLLKRWLNFRGYTDEEIQENDLRCVGTHVVWPYYEFDSLVYWQSRSYLNKRFRFPDTQVYEKNKLVGNVTATKGQFLYGFDSINFNDYLIIVEAIFDKHSLGEQCVATGGAILTQDQLQKIRMINPKKGLILAPDNDKAGLKSAVSNYHLISQLGYPIYYSVFGPKAYNGAKDWNELITGCKMAKEEVRKVFDKNIIKLGIPSLMDLNRRIQYGSS